MKDGVCPKCGAHDVVPRLPILDPGFAYKSTDPSKVSLFIIIEEKPDALILNKAMRFKVKAWVCGQCGYTELYTDSPHKLKESAQQRIANKKVKNKKQ